MRRCVPMVARIKDPTLRDEYARSWPAGWAGTTWPRWWAGSATSRRAASIRRRGDAVERPDGRRRGRAARSAGSDAVAAAGGAEVRAAVRGAGGPVFDADGGELHPSGVCGAGRHRGGGRHLGGRLGCGMDRGGAPADRFGGGREPGQRTRRGIDQRRRRREAAALTSAECSPGCRKWRSVGRSPRSNPSCSACRRWSRATNTTRCSATWSPWRLIAAACWNRPVATTLRKPAATRYGVDALGPLVKGNLVASKKTRRVIASALSGAAVAGPVIAATTISAAEPSTRLTRRMPRMVRQSRGRQVPVLLERHADQRRHTGGIFGPRTAWRQYRAVDPAGTTINQSVG